MIIEDRNSKTTISADAGKLDQQLIDSRYAAITALAKSFVTKVKNLSRCFDAAFREIKTIHEWTDRLSFNSFQQQPSAAANENLSLLELSVLEDFLRSLH